MVEITFGSSMLFAASFFVCILHTGYSRGQCIRADYVSERKRESDRNGRKKVCMKIKEKETDRETERGGSFLLLSRHTPVNKDFVVP